MTTTFLLNSSFSEKPVHIIGLGWLGLPLAKHLFELGMNVSGTVTRKVKQKQLQNDGLDVDMFDMYEPFSAQYANDKALIKQRFENANVVINIPPGRQSFNKDLYMSCMVNLIDTAMKAGLEKLVFISTTSVYGHETGVISKASELNPRTESGKAHQQVERYLAEYYPNRFKILRPAGLIGPNADASLRHPVFTLCQKQDITKARDPVNLVHQADVIQAIVALLVKKTKSSSYNLAALEHPSRKAYYTWCAQQLNLPLPRFIDDTKKRQLGKLIDANNTYTELDISAKYSSPYAMLDT